MANVSITEKSKEVECVKSASFSGTHLTQVHALSLSLVSGPSHRGCHLPHWALAQKLLPSPLLVLPASSMVEGHRYSCLAYTLAHFEESYRAPRARVMISLTHPQGPGHREG